MSFRGVTFGGENVTPANDGGLYAAHHGDGILLGCSMSLSGTDLIVSSGEFIACGRVVMVDGATSVDLSGVSITDGYVQVIMNLEPTNTPMYYTSLVESASTTFPSLTQQDLNLSGTQYQMELAVVQMVGGSPSSIYKSIQASSLIVNSDVGNPNIWLSTNGTQDGVIYESATDQTTIISAFDSGNIMAGSVYSKDGSACTHFATNGQIKFRPLASNSTTYQSYIDTDGSFNFGGQRVGGLTVDGTENSSASISVSANTATQIASKSLVSGGLYIAYANVSFTPSSAVGGYTVLDFNYVKSIYGQKRVRYYFPADTSEHRIGIFSWVTGSSTWQNCVLTIQTPSAGTVSAYEFYVIRVA